MSYRQVDMVNEDKDLKVFEFYTEYLKWKGNDLPDLTGPTSNRQHAIGTANDESSTSLTKKRKLSKSEVSESNKRVCSYQGEIKLNMGNLIAKSQKTVKEIVDEKIFEYHRTAKQQDVLTINRLSWASISDMEELGEGAWSEVSKALIRQDNDYYKVAVKIQDQNIDWEELEVSPIDMLLNEAIALKSLKNVRGVPHMFGIMLDEPLALVMSYHKGDTLGTLLSSGDVEGMLEAFIKICKTVRKMHHLGWAHNDLHSDNIMVHHGKRNKIHVTVLDYGLCRDLAENPHEGIYEENDDQLPDHLPEDVTSSSYKGDLADRFALCRIAYFITENMDTSLSNDEFTQAAVLGGTTEYPSTRPSPKTMSRLASKALEGFRQNINERTWNCSFVEE